MGLIHREPPFGQRLPIRVRDMRPKWYPALAIAGTAVITAVIIKALEYAR